MTRDATFDTAMGHLRAGRLGEAEKLYRQILAKRRTILTRCTCWG